VNLVHQLLEASARRSPDATFLITEGETCTFAAVDAMSSRVAAALRSGGLRKGDRVALLMPNSIGLVVALFGVLKAGGVFVTLNPDATSARVALVLADCEARVVIAAESTRAIVEPAVDASPSVSSTVWDGAAPAGDRSLADLMAWPQPLQPVRQIDADLAAIIYTSGSTGGSKGVMLMHRNLCSSVRSIAEYLDNTPDDVVLGVLPMAYSYGLLQVLVGALVGYSVLIERSFAFPHDVLNRAASHRVTGLPGVPSMFSTILQTPQLADFDLRSVRYITNAAANLPVAHIPRLQAAFSQARIFCMYGLTECTRVAYLDPDRLTDKVGSVGRPIPNLEAFVARPDGRAAALGEVGELTVRGSGVMLGYWRKPAETAAALRPGDIPEERYLRTGDLFKADEDGFLYFVGRTDDVFKTRGEKVAPREVEGAIYEMEAVAEVVVIGVPHEVDGHAVKAIVVTRPGAVLDERAVRLHCRARLPSHLVPRFVEIREALPKTESGKIRRTGLA
jgi:long-chain acyl-CoA synthetase